MAREALWIFTPEFAELWASAGHALPTGVSLLVDPGQPNRQLALFRRLRGAGAQALTVLDQGRIPAGRQWAYVADVVNRSGSNPLRGLGPQLREPFVDITALYHRPAGSPGLEVTALGRRYGDYQTVRPACGDLHHLAVVAHTEGLQVTGILVAEKSLTSLDPATLNCA